MKIKIVKENKKRQEQIDEAIRDYVMGAGLAFGGMFGGKSAHAGVEGYSAETVEVATAFAKEGVKSSKDVDKSIMYSKALEDLQIVSKTPEKEKMQSLNKEAQGLIKIIDKFLKNGSKKDLEWASNLVQKNKNVEVKQ